MRKKERHKLYGPIISTPLRIAFFLAKWHYAGNPLDHWESSSIQEHTKHFTQPLNTRVCPGIRYSDVSQSNPAAFLYLSLPKPSQSQHLLPPPPSPQLRFHLRIHLQLNIQLDLHVHFQFHLNLHILLASASSSPALAPPPFTAPYHLTLTCTGTSPYHRTPSVSSHPFIAPYHRTLSSDSKTAYSILSDYSQPIISL